MMQMRMEEKSKKKQTRKGEYPPRVLTNTIIVLAAFLVVTYVALAIFFGNHFFLKTTVNGVDCSAQSLEEARALITEEARDYVLTLVESSGKTNEINGTDINLYPVFSGDIAETLAVQNGILWPVHLFQKTDLEMETMLTYDKEELRDVLQNMSFMDRARQVEPENAYIEKTEEGLFEIVPETNGTVIDEATLEETVGDAVTRLEPYVDLTESGCYTKPQYTKDSPELTNALSQMNVYAGAKVSYQFGEDTKVLDGATIADWVTLADDFTVTLQEDKISEYVKSLAEEYDTYNKPKELVTSYGNTVTVPGGNYGWKINQEEETAMLTEEVKAGESVEREPVYEQTANSRGANDYGDTYVEINLSAQHLWLYQEGELLLDTDFVSGSIAEKHATSTGAFYVYGKETERYLVGPGYRSYVYYWMPFNGGEGMHDATWRSSFGGATYLNSGSHGCINLPKSMAGQIYENVEKGTPVLVFYDLDHAVASQAQIASMAMNKINAVGNNISLLSESTIVGARCLYNYLTDKSLVTNYSMLTYQEAVLAEQKKQASALLAAQQQALLQQSTVGNE